MDRNCLVRMGLFGALALMLAPATGSANQLNVTTAMPVRPQIYLSPSLHMDVRSRTDYDLGLSNDCRSGDRLRNSRRDRRAAGRIVEIRGGMRPAEGAAFRGSL